MNNKMETIRPITLEINKELWDKFKQNIPRTITLNDAVIKLIVKEVENERNINI